jgi:hypothetical protein
MYLSYILQLVPTSGYSLTNSFPIYGDQRRNMASAVMEGYGLVVDFNNITTEPLTWAIQEAIELPKYVLTYLLTPWCRVLPEQVTGLQLVKKFPAFHGTRRFITTLKSVRHLYLPRASPIQSIYPHPNS